MTQREKNEQRSYCVYKSNDLIQKTKYDLTISEQKIVLRLIQMIKPTDTAFQWYNFDVQEFCDLCGIDNSSGSNYKRLKSTIQNLSDKSFWVKLASGETSLCRWIQKAYIKDGSGTVKIRLDEDLLPYLLQLKDNFTSYSLCYVLGMRSKYSPRLYELIKSHEFHKHLEIELDALKEMLMADKYDYKNFKQKVLDVALNEINALSDLVVEYTPIKDKRKVVALSFDIRIKNVDETLDMITAQRMRLNDDVPDNVNFPE